MKPKLWVLLCLSLAGAGWTEEPVLRVQSIRPAEEKARTCLLQRHHSEEKSFPISVNTTGYVLDRFTTDKNTLASLEFLIGGRVAINKDTEIEVVNERSVADGKTDVTRILLKNGSLWVNADAKSLKQPLEIQTNGGVMGIRGTEFSIDQLPDGTTHLCCYESNSELGGVEVYDADGKSMGIAQPGDEIHVRRGFFKRLQRAKNLQAFRKQMMAHRAFVHIFRNQSFIKAFQGGRDTLDLGRAVPQAYSHLNHRKHPKGRGNLPGNLTCSGGDHPGFRWRGLRNASGYVVLVAKDEEFQDICLTEFTPTTQLDYPSENRPLASGTYFWRVIPLGPQDRPLSHGSQSRFEVP